MSDSTKEERFEEFLERLASVPAAVTGHEALKVLSETLNQVEDELTDIPYAPDNWQNDGRMYPPRDDSLREVAGRDDVVRYRSKVHNTYIRENGAIEIQDSNGRVVFAKDGADGKGVELPLD